MINDPSSVKERFVVTVKIGSTRNHPTRNMELISAILMLYVLYRLIKYCLELSYISDYTGKYVLITGCDTGIGHNTVLRLDKLGVNVFAACYTKDGIERLKQETSNRLVILTVFLLDFYLISARNSSLAHSEILARDFIYRSGKLCLIVKIFIGNMVHIISVPLCKQRSSKKKKLLILGTQLMIHQALHTLDNGTHTLFPAINAANHMPTLSIFIP